MRKALESPFLCLCVFLYLVCNKGAFLHSIHSTYNGSLKSNICPLSIHMLDESCNIKKLVEDQCYIL